jgi:hypothetical protein
VTFRERMERARAEAIATGRTVKLSDIKECDCGTYTRCRRHRIEDARSTRTQALRALHRAYND